MSDAATVSAETSNSATENANTNGVNEEQLNGDTNEDVENISGDEGKQQTAAEEPKEIVAKKVTGTVKWFNVKSGYGFINRNDTKEDVFVHQTAIQRNNPKKAVRSVGDGEIVEFDVVVGEKGNEASNVSGPEGAPVKGSPYAADRRRGGPRVISGRGGIYRRRGRGFFRGRGGGGRRPNPSSDQEQDEKADEDEAEAGSGEPKEGGPGRGPYRRQFRKRFVKRGGFRGSQEKQEMGDGDSGAPVDSGEEGGRSRGGRNGIRGFRPRGYRGARGGPFRGRQFRGGRGGGGFRGGRGGRDVDVVVVALLRNGRIPLKSLRHPKSTTMNKPSK